ncbi:hypothetical protein BDW67DRAFT_137553 [Aspergillus spinulosporus]
MRGRLILLPGREGCDLTGNKLFTSSHHETARPLFRTRFVCWPVRFVSKQRKPRNRAAPAVRPLLSIRLGLYWQLVRAERGWVGMALLQSAAPEARPTCEYDSVSECGSGIGAKQVSSTF